MNSDAASESDWALIRRYLGPNLDTYRADPVTLGMIEGSYEPAVTHEEAREALARLEAIYGS